MGLVARLAAGGGAVCAGWAKLSCALGSVAVCGLISAAMPGSAGAVTAPVDLFPRAAAGYVVAVDDDVLWARAADVPRPPASLTKVLTALVLLEQDWQPDAWVTVGERAAKVEGTRAHLRAGEQLKARDALGAMLVASANDACLALAEHAAGSRAAFVVRMNRRAAELGMTHSHFEHPCGLDDPRQVSTPADLLRATRTALSLPEFERIVALDHVSVRTRAGRDFSLHTTNALLGRIDGAAGVKTGFTSHAGKCLIGMVRRGGKRVIVVLLNAADRWWTASILLEEVFRAPGG